MIKRYPCQIVTLYVLGILASKWIVECRKADAGAGWHVLFWLVPAVLAAAAAAIWVRRESSGRKKFRQAVVLLLAFTTGMARMYAVSDTMERSLAGISDGQEVSVQGRISSKRSRETQYQTIQWTVCLTDSYLKTSQGVRSCGDLILYIDLRSGEPVIGNTIIISGKTKLFNEARNDGNFDERAYYQNQGYSMKIYADKDSYQVVDERRDRMREYLYRLQQRLALVYQNGMPEDEAGAICAMLLGEKSLLSFETKDLYRQSGIAHILAISGLHISILGAAAFRLLRKTGASYLSSAAMSMGLLVLFGAMTGMGLSTARAVVMFGIYLGAACCGRAYDSMNGLAAAAAWILLHEPRSLFLAGFQFSFAAVGGVLLGQEVCRIFRPGYRLAETALVSLSIQLLTLPLTAWYYYEIPVYSMLLNLFVLPFMGVVLILGLAGGVLGMLQFGGMSGLAATAGVISGGALQGCALLLRCFSRAGKLFLRFPGAVYVTGQPQAWQMAGYELILAGCVWALAKQGQKSLTVSAQNGRQGLTAQNMPDSRKYVVCSGFALCMALLFLRLPKQAEVAVLDVGQGDGIYIRTSDGLDVMIDGGSTDVKQAGTYRILPFLKSRGIAGIDLWFLSHLDQDHISGFQEMIESGYPVGEVVLAKGVVKDEAYEKMIDRLEERQIKIRYLEKGDVLRGEHACFQCISPESEGSPDDRNANSLVFLYEDGGFRGFFSGDISQKEEQKLLADGNLAPVTFYKAAHHGSKHSNAAKLLEQLRPAVSVVSCSEENDYGHPGEEAVANMEAYSGKVEYTMRSGQIRMQRQKDGLEIRRHLNDRIQIR